MPEFSVKFKIIFLAIVIASVFIGVYIYYSQKPAIPPNAPTPAAEKKSLADDENYVNKKVADFLANDRPGTSSDYAKDVVYDEIAFQEQNIAICARIKSEKIRQHCNLLLKH